MEWNLINKLFDSLQTPNEILLVIVYFITKLSSNILNSEDCNSNTFLRFISIFFNLNHNLNLFKL